MTDPFVFGVEILKIPYFLIALIIALAFLVGGYIGAMVERFRWNKLIDEGLIPRPKTRAGIPYVPRKS